MSLPFSTINSSDTPNEGRTKINNNFSIIDLVITGGTINGSGTVNRIPLWAGSLTLTDSTIYEDPTTGITIFNDVAITGDLTVLGTTFTVSASTALAGYTLITLNTGGTHVAAVGGGLLLSGGTLNGNTTWVTDNLGNWTTNTGISASGITGSTLYSGGTNLYNIFGLGSGAQTYATTLTAPSAGTYTVTHNLNTTDIIPALWNVTSGDLIYARITNRLVNSVDVIFSVSANTDVRVIIKK